MGSRVIKIWGWGHRMRRAYRWWWWWWWWCRRRIYLLRGVIFW